MKKMMSIAAIAFLMAGSSVFACNSCGCQAKKSDATACSACKPGKPCAACAAAKKKAADAKKAAAKK